MKSYKNIACIDYLNVNIALNSLPTKKTRVYTRVRRKIFIFCCSLNPGHLF